jgi:hypothetical protein
MHKQTLRHKDKSTMKGGKKKKDLKKILPIID